jgi:hypothetical protein
LNVHPAGDVAVVGAVILTYAALPYPVNDAPASAEIACVLLWPVAVVHDASV